jgi:ribosomal-protein-alanine N-acetyltransferase
MTTASESACFIRPVTARDRRAFLEMTRASATLHQPWISPPVTERAFDLYLARMTSAEHTGLLICRASDRGIAGVVNLNGIVRGTFLCASLGYYAAADSAGRGFMTAGLRLAVMHAFTELGLHRLEANIQPANVRSIALARRCGFTREGLSARFLFVDGAWRDHERWAICDERATLQPAHHS